MASTTVYLKLRARWGKSEIWNRQKNEYEIPLHGFHVEGVTKNRPQRASGPVMKLTLNIPDQAFMPLRPTVTIDVPENALDYTPTVTVELPDIRMCGEVVTVNDGTTWQCLRDAGHDGDCDPGEIA